MKKLSSTAIDLASCFSYQPSVISSLNSVCLRMASEMFLLITLKYFCMRDITTRALHVHVCLHMHMHAYCGCTTSSHIVRQSSPRHSKLTSSRPASYSSFRVHQTGSITKPFFSIMPPRKFPNLCSNFNCYNILSPY